MKCNDDWVAENLSCLNIALCVRQPQWSPLSCLQLSLVTGISTGDAQTWSEYTGHNEDGQYWSNWKLESVTTMTSLTTTYKTCNL